MTIDAETYHDYYNVVANPMLWFIQHYLWDLSNAPDIRHEELTAWEHGYLAANRAFAEAVIEELAEDPDRVVMLHDYHLYTAPETIRAAHPNAFLHFFVHIPWSQSDYWRILPQQHPRGDPARDAGQRHHRLPHLAVRAQLPALLRGAARPARRLRAPPGALAGARRVGAVLPDLGQRARCSRSSRGAPR